MSGPFQYLYTESLVHIKFSNLSPQNTRSRTTNSTVCPVIDHCTNETRNGLSYHLPVFVSVNRRTQNPGELFPIILPLASL